MNNESIEKVRLHKLKCGRTLESFIFNHGEIYGPLKYQEFCDKSKHTLEMFIIKWGEHDGNLKWGNYIELWSSDSEKINKEKINKILKNKL